MVSNKIITWVVLAGAAEAKIYEHRHKNNSFKLHHELDHPEGRLKTHDLVTEHPGRYASGSSTGAFSQDHNSKDNENTRFAKEIVDYLDHARTTNKFDEVIVIMSPHFYGLFEKHLGHELKKKIVRHLMKDYSNMPEKELLETVFPKQEIET